jgi:hypothetical protein
MTGEAADVLDRLAMAATNAGVFGRIERGRDLLKCEALASAEVAWYCVGRDQWHWFVELVTDDRWLNESIEADLLHRGEPIEELLAEELDELDYTGDPPRVHHYRSDEMLYTYRSPLTDTGGDDAPVHVEQMVCLLLAYEAVFRELGEMDAAASRDHDD